ncbi:hypothetical protein [Streptomyces sp. NPDC055287]
MNKKLTRRILGTALPAVLLAGAVGGGLAYIRHTVDSADVTARTTVWERTDAEPGKDPAGDVGRGKDSTGLSKLLLPVPDEYRLGPDIDAYGNDSELSSTQAVALLKESGRGASGSQRREYERRIDKLGVQGIAMRSYTSGEGDLVVRTEIVRMKDKKKIHDLYGLRTELLNFFDVPKGPEIKGHQKAHCVMSAPADGLTGTDPESKLGGMACMAYDDELLVSVVASGTEPFAKSAVAELVKDQLDHIVSPGEYI